MSAPWWLFLAGLVVLQVVVTWGTSKITERRMYAFLRVHFVEYADEIHNFYVPMLEQQAQRDPEVAESCEVAVASLREREQLLRLMAAGRMWRARAAATRMGWRPWS